MQSWSYLHVHVCDSDQNFSWVYFHFMQTIQMDQDHQQKKKNILKPEGNMKMLSSS